MSSDSDEDIFLATQFSPKVTYLKSVSEVSAVKMSVVDYFFLVVFDWNLMVGNPFQMYVWESIKDFPEEWIKGTLTMINRQKKIAIASFGGGNYSLFCKVEKGRILE